MEIIRSITVFVWKITLGCLHRYLFVSMSVKILFVFISDKRFLQFLVKTTSCLHRVRHILTLLFWQKFSENLFGSCRRDTVDLLIPPPLRLFIYSKRLFCFNSLLLFTCFGGTTTAGHLQCRVSSVLFICSWSYSIKIDFVVGENLYSGG